MPSMARAAPGVPGPGPLTDARAPGIIPVMSTYQRGALSGSAADAATSAGGRAGDHDAGHYLDTHAGSTDRRPGRRPAESRNAQSIG
jgi:hypothetical protein